MTTGATGQLGLALPVQGELSGTWGDTVNNGITQYTNIAIAGTLTLTNDGAVTLANTTGDASASNITSSLTGAGTVTAQFAIVRVTGTLTTAKVVTAPSYSKTYTVVNAATGGIVTFKASGQTGVSVAVGETAFVYFNGTDYVKVVGTATAGAAGGSNTQVQFNSSGILSGSSSLTWDGTTLSSTQVNITGQGTLRLQDTTGGEYVGLRSPSALGASYTLTFPADDGTSGQALITDGSGVLSWSTAASGDVYGPGSSTDNAVARFDSTTGKIIQNSVVIVGDTGDVTGVGTLSAATLTLTNALGTAYGGTGLTSFTSGGVVYASSTSALATGSALTFDGNKLNTNALSFSYNTSYYNTDNSISNYASGNYLYVSGNGTTTGGLYLQGGGNQKQAIIIDGISTGGNIAFNTNGTERMRLDSSGNLGIGTSSPSGTRLNVFDAGSVKLLSFGTSSSGTGSQYGTWINTGAYTLWGIESSTAGGTFTGSLAYSSVWGTNNSTAMHFSPNNVVAMTLVNGGNVGIGTTSPLNKLNVRGTEGNLRIDPDSVSSEIQLLTTTIANDGFRDFRMRTNQIMLDTNGSERMRITSAGNVGIGTSNPASLLELNRTLTNDYSALRFSNSGAGGRSYEIGLGGNAAAAGYANNLYFYDSTAGLNRMVLDPSGNLGIGSSSPDFASSGDKVLNITGSSVRGSLLLVNSSTGTTGVAGSIKSYNGSTFLTSIDFEAAGATNSGQMIFYTANAGTTAERMRIRSDGNVGFGCTPSAVSTYKVMEMNGTAGSILYMQTNGTRTLQFYSAAAEAGLYQMANAPLLFATNNTEKARFTAAGELLVGATAVGNGGKLYVNGSISLGTSTTGAQSSMAKDTTQLTTSISTSATTIYTDISSGMSSASAGYFIIHGSNNAGAGFMDVVIAKASGTPVVVSSSTIEGSPAARTYSVSSFALQLTMASGTYNVNLKATVLGYPF
jgi:hypothetical protein